MEKLRAVDFTGQRGSWHATVKYDDGTSETLPCVHAHFWETGWRRCLLPGPGSDPDLQGEGVPKALGQPAQDAAGDPDHAPGNGRFERTDYIGVYDIADAECTEESGLFFRFISRVA